MNPKVSIIIPSIRPKNLVKVYNSLLKACKKNDFELIIPSPYIIHEELLKSGQVTFIHTYANPNVCFMQGAALARGEYIYNTTDDGLVQEDVLDIAIDFFEKELKPIDVLNLTYIEGVLDFETLELITVPKPFHSNYWVAGACPEFQLPTINPHWRLAMHFFMKRDYFEKLGGFEMSFEYSNHSLHDLAFRAQYNGSKVCDLPITAFLCSHAPGEMKDHKPVNDSQLYHDAPLFNKIYTKPSAVSSRVHLDINAWKNCSKIWERRFNKNNLPLNV